jgi:hypothetical protein
LGGDLQKEVLDQHAIDKHLLDQQVFWVVLEVVLDLDLDLLGSGFWSGLS